MEPTKGRSKGGANIFAQRAVKRLRTAMRHVLGHRGGNVLVTFALTLPVVLALVGAGIDFSYAEGSKTNLQDASDAAALAVAAEVVKNPNDTKATLQALAQSVLNANYNGSPAPTITDFHVCAPVQADCTDGSNSIPSDTVVIKESATSPCTLAGLVPMICSGNPPGVPIAALSNTTIGFGATMQLNIVVDSSASMIVGSTPADVTTISNWAAQKTTISNENCTKGANGNTMQKQSCYHYVNWNTVHPQAQVADWAVNGGAPCYGTYSSCNTQDNPPCAFACHDNGDSTTAANIQAGLTDAHTAGATTRFDVMISALLNSNTANGPIGLIPSIQSLLASNTHLASNTYLFNIYSFDTTVHQYGTSNMPCTSTSCSSVTNAIGTITPGLDTYLNNAMQSFAATSGTGAIGPNGNGSSSSSPLKFMILVTDGLQSSRDLNWQDCTSWGTYAPWSFGNACLAGEFDTPINTANCTTLKNEGIVLAVLETPYVPLTGQDPDETPYEGTVRDVIYPGGPSTASAVSAALQTCATSGYYFQATSSSQIATGFTQLTNQFIQQHSYLSK
jgi:Flp pilus assembly protein TadG